MPHVGIWIGSAMVVSRAIARPYYTNAISEIINQRVASKERAITISTYNMLEKIPYLVAGYGIGVAMDLWSAKSFAFVFALLFAVILVPQVVLSFRKKTI